MTIELGIAMVVGLAQLIVAIATLLKLIQTHKTFNSKMDVAMQAQRKLGHAEGKLDEKAAEGIRQGEAGMSKAQIEETIHK